MSLDFEDESVASNVEASVNTTQRVHAADKRMINSSTDVNQLVPFKYKWAWHFYLDACANNWMPMEFDLKTDVAHWLSPDMLTPADRLIIAKSLWALQDAAQRGSGQVAMGLYRYITAPEGRQYILRQGFEEMLQPHAFAYMTEAIQVDISNMAPSNVEERNGFLAPHISVLTTPTFKTGTLEANRELVKAIVVYGCLVKGLFGMVNFADTLGLGHRNRMPSYVAMTRNMVRDQVMHCTFNIEVIEAIKIENPALWSSVFQAQLRQLFVQAVRIEMADIERTRPHEAANALAYLQVIANRRASQIGLDAIFPNTKNPYPYMGELLGLRRDDAITAKVAENKTTGTLEW